MLSRIESVLPGVSHVSFDASPPGFHWLNLEWSVDCRCPGARHPHLRSSLREGRVLVYSPYCAVNAVWRGSASSGEAQHRLARLSTVWQGSAPSGEAQHRLARLSTVWRGSAPSDEAQHRLARLSTVWLGSAPSG